MGFFKEDNEEILEAPNFVSAPTYTLVKEERDTYTLPIDGWYWFDTSEEAYNFFQINYKDMTINE